MIAVYAGADSLTNLHTVLQPGKDWFPKCFKLSRSASMLEIRKINWLPNRRGNL